MLRIEIDMVFAVRPSKGERRFNGLLLKTSVSTVEFMDEALRVLVAFRDGCEPGYSRVLAARIADDDVWKAQLKAAAKVDEFRPTHLAQFDAEGVDAIEAPPAPVVEEDEEVEALDPVLAAQIDLFAA
jgi:hypothetical protein